MSFRPDQLGGQTFRGAPIYFLARTALEEMAKRTDPIREQYRHLEMQVQVGSFALGGNLPLRAAGTHSGVDFVFVGSYSHGTTLHTTTPKQHGTHGLLESRASHEVRDAAVHELLSDAPENAQMLKRSAQMLELVFVCGAVLEAARDLKLTTIQELCSDERALRSAMAITSTAGLDVRRVIDENRDEMEGDVSAVSPSGPLVELDAFVRQAKSIVAVCPIEKLEAVGKKLEGLSSLKGLEALGKYGWSDWAARSRHAYDALKAFVDRNELRGPAQLSTVGQAYAQGRLTIDEVAKVLGKSKADALVLLEENGFCRTIDAIAMTDRARGEALARIREDRLRRGGNPEPSEERVASEVIATQRLEGIDARPWVKVPR